ncbi:MAG: hypothetical protein A3J46_04825 [Candidatus Yanofskybacteria bacterium RIFCSPHIGHO2_02_FULL_41_11]|uniref:Uncharacterized protein n=1 Tax=Candidatus Yanofskybacteria bacterium RIFCSPHIGHO2_02_FULL_41_11 TaxID=1802675 RepID=A0A1F8F876_9BACT|nr:MAG: hypothetical protein A3J46_04825 [Candidatus Yanofskybacteria bacterium RIFCSPHIGHO2_02_FULL_41_11]
MHFPGELEVLSSGSGGLDCAILARPPLEAASLVGGQFIEREGGICQASSNREELGVCGKVRFPRELFRPMNETEKTLAGMFLKSGICYTRGTLKLQAERIGEPMELVIKRRPILVPDYVYY